MSICQECPKSQRCPELGRTMRDRERTPVQLLSANDTFQPFHLKWTGRDQEMRPYSPPSNQPPQQPDIAAPHFSPEQQSSASHPLSSYVPFRLVWARTAVETLVALLRDLIVPEYMSREQRGVRNVSMVMARGVPRLYTVSRVNAIESLGRFCV
jgi:hypothetical protein